MNLGYEYIKQPPDFCLYYHCRKCHTPISNLKSTAIEMPPTSEKVMAVQELGAQDFVVTVTSPPPPPYEAGESLKAKKPEATSKEVKKPEAKSKDVQRRRKKAKRKLKPLDVLEEEEVLFLRDEESLPGDDDDGGVVTLSAERSHDPSCDHLHGRGRQEDHSIASGDTEGDNSHTSTREHLSNSGATPTREGEGHSVVTPTSSLASQETAPLISH